MTKKQLMLKMNMRLVSLDEKKRSEIINHYISVIDQSMANGNTEESSVDSLGSINSLCSCILKKEKKTATVPMIFTVLNYIGGVIAGLCIIAFIALLAITSGMLIYTGYSLFKMMLASFLPSAHLIAASFMAALFKIGACLIISCILMIMLIFIKAFITGIVKVVIYLTQKVRDTIYMIQSTKLMKEAFKNETTV